MSHRYPPVAMRYVRFNTYGLEKVYSVILLFLLLFLVCGLLDNLDRENRGSENAKPS